jgi:hypothetical protein
MLLLELVKCLEAAEKALPEEKSVCQAVEQDL